MQNTETRQWEWTPPPFMNRVMMTLLRIPVLRRVMSDSILLLTFTGHKSGKIYKFPIGYWKEDDTVTLLTKKFRPWWRNFQKPALVKVRIDGRIYTGQAQASTDETMAVPLLARLMEGRTRQAQVWHVHLDANGKPNLGDIRAIAPKIVVIQIALSN